MTEVEALRALLNGKKIRDVDWGKGEYIHIVNGDIVDQDGDEASFNSIVFDEWQIYSENQIDFLGLGASVKDNEIIGLSISRGNSSLFTTYSKISIENPRDFIYVLGKIIGEYNQMKLQILEK